MRFQPSWRHLLRIAFAAALSIPASSSLGETATQSSADSASDPMKKLEWLKSRPTPPPVRRANFRTSENRAPTLRATESRPPVVPPAEAKAPPPRAPEPPAATPAPLPPKAPAPPIREAQPPAVAPAKVLPKPIAKAATPTPPPPIATGPKLRSAEAKPATPPPVVTRLAKTTIPDAKTLTVHTTTLAARATPVLRTTPVPRTTTDPRYPWKSNIVTTVFWVGEPVGGNNFTHNFSSSWDANWSQSYGGFDNPNPQARHRFIPVKFVPKQNPFYIALPYNDVTRGTTKPEARSVIPWFRQAFRREGQSVCRDRWVAVRNRAGRIGYAQWSDCGPFRTDHWQYVFGTERPKPNLNKGAGLDVSPALRDYLGLQGTDMTDWKFVEFKDVPNGPWSLYGANNPFANKTALSNTQVVRSSGAGSSDALVRNP